METMNALVNTTPGHAEIQRVPIPSCGKGEVLVRVQSAALCGTDLHILEWDSWAQGAGLRLPFILGHECCGDVVSTGEDVSGLRAGDKVAVETHVPCGRCDRCLNGEQHICHNLTLFGIHMNGCFAEYAIVPAICIRKIPEAIDYDFGSLMEPIGTAFRAVFESHVGGCNVLILGYGPIGLFAVASAKTLGAHQVTACDVSASRLDIARRVGADRLLNPQETDIRALILNDTHSYGVDVIIEASGNAAALQESIRLLRKGGTVALIGLPGQPVAFDIGKDIVFKEAKVTGFHGRRMFSTWSRVERLLSTNRLNVGPVMTHVLPLEQWREGVRLARLGEACKVIFHPAGHA